MAKYLDVEHSLLIRSTWQLIRPKILKCEVGIVPLKRNGTFASVEGSSDNEQGDDPDTQRPKEAGDHLVPVVYRRCSKTPDGFKTLLGTKPRGSWVSSPMIPVCPKILITPEIIYPTLHLCRNQSSNPKRGGEVTNFAC
jgi:hypothetical protein